MRRAGSRLHGTAGAGTRPGAGTPGHAESPTHRGDRRTPPRRRPLPPAKRRSTSAQACHTPSPRRPAGRTPQPGTGRPRPTPSCTGPPDLARRPGRGGARTRASPRQRRPAASSRRPPPAPAACCPAGPARAPSTPRSGGQRSCAARACRPTGRTDLRSRSDPRVVVSRPPAPPPPARRTPATAPGRPPACARQVVETSGAPRPPWPASRPPASRPATRHAAWTGGSGPG